MEIFRSYNTATDIYFPLVDFGATDFESTPVTFAAGDTQYSIDKGAFGNTGSDPAHEGNGIYSLALTAAEVTGSVIVITIIDQTVPKAWEDQSVIIHTGLSGQLEANKAIIIGEVETATTAATTTALEALTISPTTTEETVADIFNGRTILFTDGVAFGEQSTITDYALANSNMFLTYDAIISTPADGDHFVII